MNKKVLVISASLRPGSNSHALAEQFAEGAREAGHEVELVSLRGREIQFCRGCTACQKTGSCVIRDDVAPLLEKLRTAQVVAFATPIYYYELCGQLKTFLDRTEPLYGRENAFRQVYLLSAAAETEGFVPKRAESGIQGWIDCYENLELAGTVFAGGVQGPGEMAGHPVKRKQAGGIERSRPPAYLMRNELTVSLPGRTEQRCRGRNGHRSPGQWWRCTPA